jgi:Outer membrane protein beta-barrel domain
MELATGHRRRIDTDKEDQMLKQSAPIGASLTAALALCAAPAFAADDNDNTKGFYVGAAIGDFSADLDRPDDVDDVDLDFDNEDASRIFAGWRFNRFAAFQLDWTDFGESNAAPTFLGLRAESDALTPSIVGTLPLGPVELYAKAGWMFYNVEVNNTAGRLVDDSGNDPVYGVGIGFTAFERLNFRVEYERIDIEQFDDANALWLSANWRF